MLCIGTTHKPYRGAYLSLAFLRPIELVICVRDGYDLGMASKRVLILGNMDKPGVAEEIERLRPWFEQRVEIVGIRSADENCWDGGPVDFCVVFGGDGTLLSAGRMMAGTGVALLGVNMGKLGFLADFSVEHMQKHFDEVLRGEVPPTERLMLDVRVREGEREILRSPATNDVAISAGAPFRMIDLHVAQGPETVAQYLGDGLVVSTPTGSTGYNLSTGGPLLHPTLQAVVITPIAPHTLSLRPMVLQPQPPICITARRVNRGTSVIIDGQIVEDLCDGQCVEVHPAAEPLRILPHPGRHHFDTLASKLQWGQSPHHSQ